MRQGRRWSKDQPEPECHSRNPDHRRDEIGRDPVGKLGQRRFSRLCLLHEAEDVGQRRVSPDLGGFDPQAAGLIQRRADHHIPGLLVHWQAFARDHGFVHGRSAVSHDPVHRRLLPRSHHDQIADLHLFDRDVSLVTVPDDPRLLGLKPRQLPDCL